MEIGDYIRIDGYISKIGHISKSSSGKTYAQWQQPNGILASGNINIIEKSSSNIADIIELGDYVNGNPVCLIKEDEHNRKWIYTDSNYKCGYLEEDIETILTHEQFDKWMYKAGDINE